MDATYAVNNVEENGFALKTFARRRSELGVFVG